MASFWFSKAGELFVAATLDMLGDNIRGILMQSTYIPDLDNDNFVSAITGFEVTGAARTVDLVGKTFNYNTGPNAWEFKHTAPTLGSPPAGETIGYLVLYKFITNDADSPLLVLDDVEPDVPTTGGLVTYNPPANGHQLVHV